MGVGTQRRRYRRRCFNEASSLGTERSVARGQARPSGLDGARESYATGQLDMANLGNETLLGSLWSRQEYATLETTRDRRLMSAVRVARRQCPLMDMPTPRSYRRLEQLNTGS
jgi:hypothetical protein